MKRSCLLPNSTDITSPLIPVRHIDHIALYSCWCSLLTPLFVFRFYFLSSLTFFNSIGLTEVDICVYLSTWFFSNILLSSYVHVTILTVGREKKIKVSMRIICNRYWDKKYEEYMIFRYFFALLSNGWKEYLNTKKMKMKTIKWPRDENNNHLHFIIWIQIKRNMRV